MSSHSYSIAIDTPNALLNASKLHVEIDNSSISPTLDDISTNDDVLIATFSSVLSAGELTTLDALIASHDGQPDSELVAPQMVQVQGQEYDASGNITQRSVSQKTQELTYTRATHDLCNKTTWYTNSVSVVDELLTLDSGTTYSASNSHFIDVINGLIHRQDLHQLTHGIQVKIDDVVQLSGYTIDHVLGAITFDSGPVGDVKCSYHYATDSVWKLSVSAGKILVIEHSEVQLTEDVQVSSPLVFQVWVDNPYFAVVGHPYEGIPRIAGETIKYNSIRDVINESNLGFTVPAMPEIGKALIIFPFDYIGEKLLHSSINAELWVYSENSVELPGTYGTATFYLIERDM